MGTLHYRADIGGGGTSSSSKTVEKDFINSDLTKGNLVVNHNLGKKFASVKIWSNEGEPIIPDRINVNDENTATVTLSSFQPLIGTWHIIIN